MFLDKQIRVDVDTIVSFVMYTKRASVRGRSKCQRAEQVSEGGASVGGRSKCQRAEQVSEGGASVKGRSKCQRAEQVSESHQDNINLELRIHGKVVINKL